MVNKLEKWELGYALAILNCVGHNCSVRKTDLTNIFSARIIVWLAEKDLIIFGDLNVEENVVEVRAVLGKRAKDIMKLETRDAQIVILESI